MILYSPERADVQNAVLLSLEAFDWELLSPHLEPVALGRGTMLERRGRRTDYVYFLNSGIASVIAGQGRGAYVGMVGRDGMTALATIMGAERAPFDTTMQLAGRGHRARVETVREGFNASLTLRNRILDYAQKFLTQVGVTAAVNASNKLPERLARWLLVAQDHADAHELELTHDVLAQMLGVRRAGVTVTLGQLESRGLIERRRGAIAIRNRDGLLAQANGSYTMAD
jgi:CRP-like cAMP-binding protein